MKKRRTLAAFLAFVLMAAVLIVGCQNEGEKGAENSTGAGTTGVGSGTVGTSQEETTEFPYPQIPEGTDYSGRTFSTLFVAGQLTQLLHYRRRIFRGC